MLTDPDPSPAVAVSALGDSQTRRAATRCPTPTPSLDDAWLASLAEPDPAPTTMAGQPCRPDETLQRRRTAPRTVDNRPRRDPPLAPTMARPPTRSFGSPTPATPTPAAARCTNTRPRAAFPATASSRSTSRPPTSTPTPTPRRGPPPTSATGSARPRDRRPPRRRARSSPTTDSATPPTTGPPHRPPAPTAQATDHELVAAGLASYATTGRLIDPFRDRLVFPVTALGAEPARPRSTASSPAATPTTTRTRRAADPVTDAARPEVPQHRRDRPVPQGPRAVRPRRGPHPARRRRHPGPRRRPDGRHRRHPRRRRPLRRPRPDGHRAHRRPGRPAHPARNPADHGLISATIRSASAAHRCHRHRPGRHRSRPPRLLAAGPARREPASTHAHGGKDPAEMLHDHGAASTPRRPRQLPLARRRARQRRHRRTRRPARHRRRRRGRHPPLQPKSSPRCRPISGHRTSPGSCSAPASPSTPSPARCSTPTTNGSADPARSPRARAAAACPPPRPPTPTARWAQLAESINPRLTVDPSWPSLARALDRAAATGYDVQTQLPALANRRPLPHEHPARSLEYRLLDAHPDAADPTHSTPKLGQARAAETDAAARLAADAPHQPTPQQPRASAPAVKPQPVVTPTDSPTRDRAREQSPRR